MASAEHSYVSSGIVTTSLLSSALSRFQRCWFPNPTLLRLTDFKALARVCISFQEGLQRRAGENHSQDFENILTGEVFRLAFAGGFAPLLSRTSEMRSSEMMTV
jgi:hypothetical protein